MEQSNWENDKQRWRKARQAGSMAYVEHMPEFIDGLLAELKESEARAEFFSSLCMRMKNDAEVVGFADKLHKDAEKIKKQQQQQQQQAERELLLGLKPLKSRRKSRRKS